jgi:hypothetical protein
MLKSGLSVDITRCLPTGTGAVLQDERSSRDKVIDVSICVIFQAAL